MLQLLPLNIIINGKSIYRLRHGRPIIIDAGSGVVRMVVTDGYHMTHPVDIAFNHSSIHCFTLGCIIDNTQLVVGLLLTLFFGIISFTTGFLALLVISLVPVAVFGVYYYLWRSAFLVLRVVQAA